MVPMVEVSTVEGLHVPVIPFVEVVGKTTTSFKQYVVGVEVKVGVVVEAPQGTLQVNVWAGIQGSVAWVNFNVAECQGNIPNMCQWDNPVLPVTTGPP